MTRDARVSGPSGMPVSGRRRCRGGHPWYIRFWQRCTLWAITLDCTVTWWASDDIHVRERKLDHEIRFPRWLFKPICWLTKHEDYYGECVICANAMSGRKARQRIDATCGHSNCKNVGTYELPGRCSNCGLTGRVTYTKGHETGRERCPNCGVKAVRAVMQSAG